LATRPTETGIYLEGGGVAEGDSTFGVAAAPVVGVDSILTLIRTGSGVAGAIVGRATTRLVTVAFEIDDRFIPVADSTRLTTGAL
jgi:hypothetical protein